MSVLVACPTCRVGRMKPRSNDFHCIQCGSVATARCYFCGHPATREGLQPWEAAIACGRVECQAEAAAYREELRAGA